MKTLTKDFSGSYDWPEEEAILEAESFNEYSSEYAYEELQEKLFKLGYHWLTVFGNDKQGQEDYARFVAVFNANVEDKYSLS